VTGLKPATAAVARPHNACAAASAPATLPAGRGGRPACGSPASPRAPAAIAKAPELVRQTRATAAAAARPPSAAPDIGTSLDAVRSARRRVAPRPRLPSASLPPPASAFLGSICATGIYLYDSAGGHRGQRLCLGGKQVRLFGDLGFNALFNLSSLLPKASRWLHLSVLGIRYSTPPSTSRLNAIAIYSVAVPSWWMTAILVLAPAFFLPGALDPGCCNHARGRASRRFSADAICRTRRGRQCSPHAVRALSRLPAVE